MNVHSGAHVHNPASGIEPSDNRARLVQAALGLFAVHGYASTSVRRIAQEAGVSQGLLYTYFPGKHALLQEIFETGMRGVAESFARMDEAGSPAERLEVLVRSAVEIVRRDASFWQLFYGLRFQPATVEDLGDAIANSSAAILETLESLLRSVGVADPAAEARVLFATIDGLAQHALLDPDHYPVDAAIAAVLARHTGAHRPSPEPA
jgi:AcrR family transcriptional regulator